MDILDKTDPVLPTQEDARLAEEASRRIASAQPETLRVRLDDNTELKLPEAARRLLIHLLSEMSRGNAVTIIPIHAELTTQEAANLLNVSRHHLVELIDRGEIPHRMVGTHRRIRFEDLDAYLQDRKAKQKAALDQLAEQAQELGMGY
jgi:excisionase family DNA binding protein